jgi:hypothetical protein
MYNNKNLLVWNICRPVKRTHFLMVTECEIYLLQEENERRTNEGFFSRKL